MLTLLDNVRERPLPNLVTVSNTFFRHLIAVVSGSRPRLSISDWKTKVGGVLIDSRFGHLTLAEAVDELLKKEANKAAHVNAWLSALLDAQVRPRHSDSIGTSLNYSLKCRSGHQARAPPTKEIAC